MSQQSCRQDQTSVEALRRCPQRIRHGYALVGAALAAAFVMYGLGVASAGARMRLRGSPFTEEVQQFGSLEGGFLGPNGVGVALSADGSTAAIAGSLSGEEEVAVQVFVHSGGKWVPQGPPVVPPGQEHISHHEYFNTGPGVALSADGSTLLIGNPRDDSGAGAAWVFARSGETWTQQGSKLTPAETTGLEEEFGWQVALSDDGSTALIGDTRGFPNYKGMSGAWVFARSGETWTQQSGKLGPKRVIGEASVALSGDGSTALIGNGAESEAWVYTRSGETWNKQAELAARAGEASGNSPEFGSAVALSRDGNTALVGAKKDYYDEGHIGGAANGAAYAFTRSGETWTQQGPKLTGPHGRFGFAVALSGNGNIALVGAPTTTVAGERIVGAVAVSERSHGVWGKFETLKGQGGSLSYFGSSVALSSDGDSALIANVDKAWAFADRPEVKSFSPTTGPASGGTSVTITGSHLEGATAVDFGPTPASFTVNSPTSITAIAPEGSGTVTVSVTTPEGTATSHKRFKYT
jgi:IPT/TIG domain-containing protein/FG-GAP repeat protein